MHRLSKYVLRPSCMYICEVNFLLNTCTAPSNVFNLQQQIDAYVALLEFNRLNGKFLNICMTILLQGGNDMVRYDLMSAQVIAAI